MRRWPRQREDYIEVICCVDEELYGRFLRLPDSDRVSAEAARELSESWTRCWRS